MTIQDEDWSVISSSSDVDNDDERSTTSSRDDEERLNGIGEAATDSSNTTFQLPRLFYGARDEDDDKTPVGSISIERRDTIVSSDLRRDTIVSELRRDSILGDLRNDFVGGIESLVGGSIEAIEHLTGISKSDIEGIKVGTPTSNFTVTSTDVSTPNTTDVEDTVVTTPIKLTPFFEIPSEKYSSLGLLIITLFTAVLFTYNVPWLNGAHIFTKPQPEPTIFSKFSTSFNGFIYEERPQPLRFWFKSETIKVNRATEFVKQGVKSVKKQTAAADIRAVLSHANRVLGEANEALTRTAVLTSKTIHEAIIYLLQLVNPYVEYFGGVISKFNLTHVKFTCGPALEWINIAKIKKDLKLKITEDARFSEFARVLSSSLDDVKAKSLNFLRTAGKVSLVITYMSAVGASRAVQAATEGVNELGARIFEVAVRITRLF